jgi:hypothetical protein
MVLPGRCCLMLACGVAAIPIQYVYTKELAKTEVLDPGGCTLMEWDGLDQDGIFGYPFMATVECPPGASFHREGVNEDDGHLRIVLRTGTMAANGERISMQGSAFWANTGAHLSLTVSGGGAVYIMGARFQLDPRKPEAVFTSNYAGPKTRSYPVMDAINGSSDWAGNGHDPHINNGTANARDLIFKSKTLVDPPSIVVMNCAPSDSYVWFHSHPTGALYLPFAGQICFVTDTTVCITPGTPRWTSPNLYYYETFRKTPDVAVPDADALIAAAFTKENASMCRSPVTFAVTNFDPANPSGQPNFVDIPADGGWKRWGAFREMTVRTTTVLSRTVRVDLPAEL